MEFPQDNPIVKLWEEIKAASGTLEDAIERVTAPEFAEALTEADVIGLGKTCEEARGLDDRPEDLTPLARLNFEGARAGDGVSEAAKRATAVCYLNVAPTVGPVALRAQHDVATAALGWADRDGDPALWASLRSHQGDALDSLGERHAAKVAFDDALGIYMALAEGEPQAFRDHVAMTYNNLGNVLSDIGERQEAEHAFGKALHIYRTLAKEEAPAFRPEVAMVLNNLGNVLRAVGKQQNAKSACHEALGLYETLADEEPGKFRDDVAMAHNNLGSVLSDMGERQEAMDECQKALDLYRTLADGGSEEFVPDVAGALSNVSVLQGHTDDPQGALESAEEAADIAKGCGAGKIEALARQAQGKALTALSRHNEARRAYERAYDLASAQTDLAQAQTNAKWIDAVCLNAKPDVVCRRLWDDFGQDLAEMAETKAKSDELVEVNIKRQASLSRGAGKGELVIARQWASFTPIPLLRTASQDTAIGGGYLLNWSDRGLAIDPGLGFTEACRQLKITLRDIDGVAVTHYHIDHSGDVPELATCFFEATEVGEKPEADFMLAPGAFGTYASLLSTVPGVSHVHLLRRGETEEWHDARVTATPARHKELTGRDDTSIGLRIELDGPTPCSVGFTADTRWQPNLKLAQAYQGVDLLVLHIGSLYDQDQGPGRYAKNHLGVKGAATLLSEVVRRGGAPKLVIISEWGEELRRHRHRICRILSDTCGVDNVVPAKFGMRVRLPELATRCDDDECEHDATHWGTHPTNPGEVHFRCGEHGGLENERELK